MLGELQSKFIVAKCILKLASPLSNVQTQHQSTLLCSASALYNREKLSLLAHQPLVNTVA